MKNKYRTQQQLDVPSYVYLIAKLLEMTFHPNKGSSFYRIPPLRLIPLFQRGWDNPIGTLRLSDHWNYTNTSGEKVFRTAIPTPSKRWTLCINTGREWKVLKTFYPKHAKNIIDFINFEEIQNEINSLIY